MFILSLTFLCSAHSQELPKLGLAPDPLYSSIGFRLGYITSVKDEGFFWWRYHYEGSLLLGVSTNKGHIYDRICLGYLDKEKGKIQKKISYMRTSVAEQDSAPSESDYNTLQNLQDDLHQIDVKKDEDCLITDNPWSFSFFDDSYYKKYLHFTYGPVLIYYRTPLLTAKELFSKTDNYLLNMWKVNPSIPLQKSMSTDEGIFNTTTFTPEKGIIQGRVVSASVESIFLKTYEVTIQLETSGNDFRRMSVSDSDLFNYIVRCMLSGRLLEIEYIKLMAVLRPLSDLRGYSTDFRIVKVTPL